MLFDHPRAAIAIPLPKRFPKGMRLHVERAIERHQVAMDGLIAFWTPSMAIPILSHHLAQASMENPPPL